MEIRALIMEMFALITTIIGIMEAMQPVEEMQHVGEMLRAEEEEAVAEEEEVVEEVVEDNDYNTSKQQTEMILFKLY
jgi:hypothetical protein